MDLKKLNEEQLKAVTHKGSPLMVLAGAGSGKTRVLTYRTGHLIESGDAKADEIVLLTFTNKAAEEMKNRVKNMGIGGALGFAGTFHTFCARLLRIHGSHLGIPREFLIYDTSDQESAMKSVLREMDLELKSNKPKLFLNLISRMKSELIDPHEYENTVSDDFQIKLLRIWKKYQETLAQSGALDFDDLLVKVVDLLKMEEVGERVRKQFRRILVDEYQDTNKAQFVLTKLLTGDPAGLTVVGDAAQAIYSFRGADFRNLKLLEKEYPELTKIELPRNYRSTQAILDAAYGVIANNTSHPVVKLLADREQGEKIKIVEMASEKEEAAYITRAVGQRVTSSGQIAVLYRTNAQSRAIEESLIRKGVSYRLVGGVRFYDRAEIKDVLAYLRVVINPADQVSWERIEGLGKKQRLRYEEFLSKNRELLIEKKPLEIIEEVLMETQYMKRFDEKDDDEVDRIENVKELAAVAHDSESLIGFLEKVALVQSDEEADRKAADAQVTLMTIHAAKGLEFEEVVIAGLEEGILPHSRSLLERADLEEERRLMYVAMTRAKEKLHLTLTRSRLVYGGRQSSSPSRFLSEIPEELMEIKTSNRLNREIIDNYSEEKPKRRIVQDWEIDKETKDDFAEIDAW